MKLIFTTTLLILITISTILPLNANGAKCHVDDESGLLAFKSGIKFDPTSILKTWIAGTDCCTWIGVTCLFDNKRVTSLSLGGDTENSKSFLVGTLSPSLSKLKYLDGLYLTNLQNISGPFPDFLFKLPNLKYVYIENIKLSGQIPENIGNLKQLEALSLEGNRFTGTIPSSISALTSLTQLKLGNNFFTGTFPASIKNLKNLTYLGLQGNQLIGNIPEIFTSFTNLIALELSRNKFSGKIPVSISSLYSNLRYLELGHNSLSGKIPDFLGKFKALDTLDLSKNQFSGTVPKSFANLTKIFNLDLSDNFLVDPFPSLNVKGIESLDLSRNKFHLKEIPKWVTSSPIIYSLKLAHCGIKIKLDDWKPSETFFYDYIDLSGNEISGSAIGLLNKTSDYLIEFRGSENLLKFDLGSLRIGNRLKVLDLSHNLVFGKVTKSVVGIEKLNVSYNHLCGEIPKNNLSASVFVGNDCLCGSPLKPCKV